MMHNFPTTTTTVQEMKRKAYRLQFISFVALSLSLVLLYLSTIKNVPWFQLVVENNYQSSILDELFHTNMSNDVELEKVFVGGGDVLKGNSLEGRENHTRTTLEDTSHQATIVEQSPPQRDSATKKFDTNAKSNLKLLQMVYTPINLSILGISTARLFPLTNNLNNGSTGFANKEKIESTTFHPPASRSLSPQTLIDAIEPAGSENSFLKVANKSQRAIDVINAPFSIQMTTSNKTLILMVWSLKSVSLSVPPLRIEERQIQMHDLAEDPFMRMALSLTGFYNSVVDLNVATNFVYALGVWSTIPIVLALLVQVAQSLKSLVKRLRFIGPMPANEILRDSSIYLGRPLLPSTNQALFYDQSLPSKVPHVLVGIFSLTSGICAAIGIWTWATRSLVDSNRILVGVVRLVGTRAAAWLEHHSAFVVDQGLIEFIAAIFLLLVTAIINLFVDFKLKRVVAYDEESVNYDAPHIAFPSNMHSPQGRLGTDGSTGLSNTISEPCS